MFVPICLALPFILHIPWNFRQSYSFFLHRDLPIQNRKFVTFLFPDKWIDGMKIFNISSIGNNDLNLDFDKF